MINVLINALNKSMYEVQSNEWTLYETNNVDFYYLKSIIINGPYENEPAQKLSIEENCYLNVCIGSLVVSATDQQPEVCS